MKRDQIVTVRWANKNYSLPRQPTTTGADRFHDARVRHGSGRDSDQGNAVLRQRQLASRRRVQDRRDGPGRTGTDAVERAERQQAVSPPTALTGKPRCPHRFPACAPNLTRFLSIIVDYVSNYKVDSTLAFETARHCLIDTLGCGLEALSYPACTKLLGPIVPGTVVPNGAKVPGTQFQLDPVQAAFNIGAMIRWLDFNDTWLAAEWGHPSDNLGGILATADWLSRSALAAGKPPLTMKGRADRDGQGA